ncbi:MAG: hypothetical protein KJ749_05210, partial [Planctomycetes bacterium]|nr:hypothetical protein [Planctomycetota bacterium]
SQEEIRELLGIELIDFQHSIERSMNEAQAMVRRRKVSATEAAEFGRWQKTQLVRFQAALKQDEPVTALIDAWAVSESLAEYLEAGEGKDRLGPVARGIAVEMLNRRREKLLMLARTYLPEEVLRGVAQHIAAFAEANPVLDRGLQEPEKQDVAKVRFSLWSLGQQTINTVVRIPLLPGRLVTGISESGRALSDIRDTTAEATQVAGQLPERIRKEIEVLLDRLREQHAEIMSILDKADSIAANVRAAGEQTQAAAANVRESIRTAESLVPAADSLLVAVETAAKSTHEAINSLSALLDQLDRSAAASKAAGQTQGFDIDAYRQTAIAIESASACVHELLAYIREWTAEGPGEHASSEPAFDIREYTEAARAIEAGAAEIRAVLTELNATADNDALHQRVTEILAQAAESGRAAETRTRGVIDYLTWRILLILVVLFGLQVAVILVHRRLRKS